MLEAATTCTGMCVDSDLLCFHPQLTERQWGVRLCTGQENTYGRDFAHCTTSPLEFDSVDFIPMDS